MSNSQQEINFSNDLAEKGYCVVPDVLGATMLTSLKERFDASELGRTPKDNFGESGAFIVADYHNPTIVQLLTWPKTLQTLQALGFSSPKLHNFYVSTKPPRAEALPWHSDLFYRYDEPAPAELFLIYYLSDTTPENGCLRVVPGSHKWSHDTRHKQPDVADLRDDEVDVPIRAGDLFIGDRRIMHATHANTTNDWRTCLTISYAPLYNQLSDPIKALIVRNRCLPPMGWWNDAQLTVDTRLRDILPIYAGDAEPIVLED